MAASVKKIYWKIDFRWSVTLIASSKMLTPAWPRQEKLLQLQTGVLSEWISTTWYNVRVQSCLLFHICKAEDWQMLFNRRVLCSPEAPAPVRRDPRAPFCQQIYFQVGIYYSEIFFIRHPGVYIVHFVVYICYLWPRKTRFACFFFHENIFCQ